MENKTYQGDLIIQENETIEVDYVEITGFVSVREDARFSAPQLTAVRGFVSVREDARFSAPQLTAVGGSVYVSEDAKFSAPRLTEKNSEKAKKISSKLKGNGWETPDGKYIIADNIVTEIVSHRGNVWEVRHLCKTKIEYLITDGNGNYAHGKTLEEAKEDLVYKVTDRKKSDYDGKKLNDTLTHEEAIRCYRTITGACSSGTRNFVENVLNGNRKEQYTIAEICELTKGQYGNTDFCRFFNYKAK